MRAWACALFLLVPLTAGCGGQAPTGTTAPTTGTTTAMTATTTSASTTTTSSSSTGPAEAWSLGNWKEAACAPTGAELAVPPRIALMGDDGTVEVLAWGGSSYGVAARGVAGATHLASGDGLWASVREGGGSKVVRLDADLQVRGTAHLAEVGALAASGPRVWAATRWNLTAFDTGMAQIGRVAVPAPADPAKALDAMAVSGGTAYVVDDIASPYYAFKVAVSDPAAMAVVQQVAFSATFAGPQWRGGDGRWWVSSGLVAPTGSLLAARHYDDEGRANATVVLESSIRPTSPTDPRPAGRSGFSVLATGFDLPAWSVLHGNRTLLARVDFQGTEARYACPATLPDGGHATVLAVGPEIVVTVDRTLRVYEAYDGLRLAHEQALDLTPVEAAWAT